MKKSKVHLHLSHIMNNQRQHPRPKQVYNLVKCVSNVFEIGGDDSVVQILIDGFLTSGDGSSVIDKPAFHMFIRAAASMHLSKDGTVEGLFLAQETEARGGSGGNQTYRPASQIGGSREFLNLTQPYAGAVGGNMAAPTPGGSEQHGYRQIVPNAGVGTRAPDLNQVVRKRSKKNPPEVPLQIGIGVPRQIGDLPGSVSVISSVSSRPLGNKTNGYKVAVNLTDDFLTRWETSCRDKGMLTADGKKKITRYWKSSCLCLTGNADVVFAKMPV